MIYSPNNKPLVLIEEAADEFLEAVGVELFEDEISINGTLYEGAYGESILEANGIFLYEDGIVLEGKQAEEYLRNKQKQITSRKADETEKLAHKYGGSTGGVYYQQGDRSVHTQDGILYTSSGKRSGRIDKNRTATNNPAYSSAHRMRDYRSKYPDAMPNTKSKNEKELEKAERKERAALKYGFDVAKKRISNPDSPRFQIAADAARRHYRRTHKNESTIFSDIEII